MKRILIPIVIGAITALVMLGISALILEWIVGCGETYIDAVGRTRYNECLFVNFPRR